jgi:hypothetical protein
LITLYWHIGQHISDRLEASEWGQKAIDQLAEFIQNQEPGIKGFEKRKLYRMRQFYKTYPDFEIVSSLLTHLTYDLQIALRTLRICIEDSDSINDREGNS